MKIVLVGNVIAITGFVSVLVNYFLYFLFKKELTSKYMSISWEIIFGTYTEYKDVVYYDKRYANFCYHPVGL